VVTLNGAGVTFTVTSTPVDSDNVRFDSSADAGLPSQQRRHQRADGPGRFVDFSPDDIAQE